MSFTLIPDKPEPPAEGAELSRALPGRWENGGWVRMGKSTEGESQAEGVGLETSEK